MSEEKKTKFLIKDDGRVFAYSTVLAKRKDMTPFDGAYPEGGVLDVKNPDKDIREVTGEIPPFLKNTKGEIFVYTAILAKRRDMFPYFGDNEPKIAGSEPTLTDPNKILQIVRAIDSLDPEQGFTHAGLPNAKELSKILGVEVTKEERDEAWEMKKKGI